MSLPTARYRPLIRAAVDLIVFPAWDEIPAWAWVEGQVMTESSGDPRATRYEPHLDTVADGDTPHHDDGPYEDDRSYGLLQVLGSNIRERWGIQRGVPMHFVAALRPLMGLALGLAHMADQLYATGQDVARALARHNGGPTGDSRSAPGYPMRCQEYVNKVRSNALKVLADEKEGA